MNYLVRNGIIIYIPKKYDGMDPKAIQKKIGDKYRNLKWRQGIVKNDCEEKKNKKKKLTFHNSQLFLKDYFTPRNIQKGMIINHSVGSGKTCSAVAVGSNFDKRGYKILWVTQHKLKNDMWKNILGNFSCHEGYRHFQDNYNIPDDYIKQKRVFHKITKKRWFPPITYKQFSNALLKKNQLGLDLYKRNEKDPLRKILVIIDESHNLFNKSLPKHQKPNISIIRKNIYESYKISKEDSVKLILLTATPLLDNIMSYFRLINLIIPRSGNRFRQKGFEEKYIKNNKFSKEGLKKFNENTSRLVSLLDLSKNQNKFAQPVMINKESKVKEVESEETIKNEIKELKGKIKNLDENIKKEINYDFKNQTEILKYIKNDENNEKKIERLNKFLDKEITEDNIKLLKKIKKKNKKKLTKLEKLLKKRGENSEKRKKEEIIKNIKDSIKNKKEELKNEKKNQKLIIDNLIKEKKEELENNSNQLDYQVKKCQNDNKKDINKNIKCLQKKNLWNSEKELAKQYRFENKNFKKELLEKNIKKFSDKLDLLFQNIERIDKKTLEKTGKLYKHIIYVHNNGYQGMKLLISCMIAKNYNFLLQKKNNKLVLEQKNSYQNFLTLTSGNIYDKTFNKKITKEINELYNERPGNINGQKCRFILIDYNYKEGIDLYDAKYFHILDSYLFETEMQQLVGRGTRNCGQKGLPFNKGWRLLTYLYYNRYDKKRSIEDIIKNLRAENIGITEFDLKIRNVIKKEIKNNAIDALLTKNLS
jgi:superfamily II DNA or RNA helicase